MIYIHENKLKDIKLSNDNFYVAIDFDRTMTTGDSIDSWEILLNPRFINPSLKEENLLLADKYFPIEFDYTIDEKTKFKYMEEWYYASMDLFFKYGLTEDILLNCVKFSNIKLRNGLKSFFKCLADYNIPVIIVSAGIENVIIELLKMNDCFYDNIHIISNLLRFENGHMLKFTDKIIHSSNKSISELPIDFKNDIEKKDYILLFGDLIEDLNMISKEDLNRTISFGFLEKRVTENLNLYRANFDVVLTNNASFDVVRDIISF